MVVGGRIATEGGVPSTIASVKRRARRHPAKATEAPVIQKRRNLLFVTWWVAMALWVVLVLPIVVTVLAVLSMGLHDFALPIAAVIVGVGVVLPLSAFGAPKWLLPLLAARRCRR